MGLIVLHEALVVLWHVGLRCGTIFSTPRSYQSYKLHDIKIFCVKLVSVLCSQFDLLVCCRRAVICNRSWCLFLIHDVNEKWAWLNGCILSVSFLYFVLSQKSIFSLLIHVCVCVRACVRACVRCALVMHNAWVIINHSCSARYIAM